MRSENCGAGECPLLVRPHQPTIAGDIGRQNGRVVFIAFVPGRARSYNGM